MGTVLAACRDEKPSTREPLEASNESGTSGAAGASQSESWPLFPMPNSAPGLPNPQSFDTERAGVVVDRITGLMWQRVLGTELVTQAEANRRCEALSLAGYDDWRLPSRLELVSILNTARTQPAIDVAAFPDTPSDWFWTSTLAAGDPDSAWYVYFYFGYPKTDQVNNQFSMRCVRSEAGRPTTSTHYEVHTETVLDRASGLTWQRAVPEATFSFDSANAYCAGLRLAGAGGFRVPSLTELLTLIDERKPEGPMIDRMAFPDTPSDAFWTSSYFGGGTGLSWQVYFDHGNGLYGLPSATFRVRCVTERP